MLILSFSLCFSAFFLSKVVQAEQKPLTHKGWVRLRPRSRSVDADRIDHGCQTLSDGQATIDNADSMGRTR